MIPNCKICDQPCNPYRGEVRIDHMPGWGVPICDKCLGQIVCNVVNARANPRPYDADGFCWLCGRTEDLAGWDRVGWDGREVRLCERCRTVLKHEARNQAGVPVDWEKQPRLCTTCLCERNGTCHREPMDHDGFPSCPSEGGCETGWRPKLIGGPS